MKELIFKDFIIEWWVQAGLAGLLGVLTWLVRKLYQRQKATTVGIQSILYYQICRESKEIKLKGTITREELRDMEYFFKAYSDLGGNGVARKLYEECISLPIED